MRIITFLIFGLINNVCAQAYEIGHSTVLLNDNSRNRSINTEIYYPANTAGDDVPPASGTFPVLVFGHGFLMSWEAYQNFWTSLVPEGYVLCFPTTEMGAAPDHAELGLDLKFIATAMQLNNSDSSSLFFNKIAAETALMGHSMGGGASFLAAENNPAITTLVNFAAAETNPSAVAAAANVTVPSLIFSGDDDCVTPAAQHQQLMYDNLGSSCKTMISINNGGHCYFANSDFFCTLGESSCNPILNISRATQQEITFNFLKLWLQDHLYQSATAWSDFNDSLQASTQITHQQSCGIPSDLTISRSEELQVFPNPSSDWVNIRLPKGIEGGILTLYNALGQVQLCKVLSTELSQFSVAELPQAVYTLVYQNDNRMYTFRLFIN